MIASASKRLILWAIFISLCTVLLMQQTLLQDEWPIEGNILALLPDNQQDPIAFKAFEKVADNLNNRVVFLIKGNDKDKLVVAAEKFSDALHSLGLFSQVDARIDPQLQQAWSTLYFPYRAQLLSQEDKRQLQSNPQARVNFVLQQVYNPFSGVSGSELSSDPFLLFRHYMSEHNSANQGFSLYKNHLLSSIEAEHYLLIQADLNGDAYDANLQSLFPELVSIEKQIEQSFHVKLLHTGSYFYAVYGTESAKSEVSTIGVGSLIGVILLLLLIYRSVLPMLLALLSIACGLLMALLVTILVFGKVHLFSLVFGASLIGVSIDYAFHYLTERLSEGEHWHAQRALKQIFNAITLGLITSLIGYLGLLIAPFPGLQQLSLFSIVGLLSAYLTVVLCYPALAKSPSRCRPPRLQVLQAWISLWSNRAFRFAFPSVLVVLAVIGLTQLHFDDDIHQLQAMPKHLKLQEAEIKQVTGVGEQQKLLLVRAESEQKLLQRVELLTAQFIDWQRQGKIQNVQSITQFVPTLHSQQQNYHLVENLYQTQGLALRETLSLSESISLLQEFTPLTIEDYLQSPVSDSLGFLWLGGIEQQYASIIVLAGINEQQLISAYVEQQADITILDKAGEISSIFSHYRVFIGEMLIAAYLLIGVLLIWRYRFKMACKVLIPPFIAGIVSLAVTVLFAIPITIFNLLALLLVLGIGIDYTLFFAEQNAQVSNKNTLLAISLSAITTVLSFGLLALSETQAIHGFGVTVLTGIVTAWLLAPLAIQHRQE